jgi:hypothetical protein
MKLELWEERKYLKDRMIELETTSKNKGVRDMYTAR